MKRFETKIRVQYYETDKMGIVHHSNYVRYLETARTELFRDKGYAYDDMEKSGIWMPVLSVSVDFKTPAVYDEVLILACWVKKLRGASIELEYEIRGRRIRGSPRDCQQQSWIHNAGAETDPAKKRSAGSV